jgi:Protein of unknown function (DUF2877)
MLCRPRGAVDFSDPLIRRAWRTTWVQLQNGSSCDGLGAMLSHRSPRSRLTAALVIRARLALPRLVQSVRQFDLSSSLAAALPLVGAGPGLTPSWDDLLIGFLCSLRAASGSDPSRWQFIDQFGRAMARASTKTTAVSSAYIQRTIAGAGPAWIEDTLAVIAAGDWIGAHAATARALRVGRTSGVDMMLGVILGSAVWQHGSEVDQVLSALSCHRSEFHLISDADVSGRRRVSLFEP